MFYGTETLSSQGSGGREPRGVPHPGEAWPPVIEPLMGSGEIDSPVENYTPFQNGFNSVGQVLEKGLKKGLKKIVVNISTF
ncbi:MAG: hypothetical protein CVV64_10040 [Candidatus Wallbacteria bacterium HGW-Wallbacteria-1]|uniref:Uncharacterized protein n=1 Tax=Candidatus Wallbacteria bacterium HGW-Wallbacteria-1 TaxID=2013854 RepID=A0A2N1PPN0_9BACT|nr:MAG: hypothetical protein CVV64_10040 [Candidatus Wallbacteria bacterium HGW-Wallbacteria-1]